MKCICIVYIFSLFSLSCSKTDMFHLADEREFWQLLDTTFVSRKVSVVVQMSSDCNVCHDMLEAWKRSNVIDNQNVRLLIYDISLYENRFLPQLLNSSVTPACLLFDINGRLSYVHEGYLSVSALQRNLKCIQAGARIPPEWNGTFYSASGVQFYQLLEWVLRAQIDLKKKDTLQMTEALMGLDRSIELEPYFMNCYLAWKLAGALGKNTMVYRKRIEQCMLEGDEMIYGDLMADIFPEKMKEENFELFLQEYDFGRNKLSETEFVIEYSNNIKRPLLIKNIVSGCDCMQIDWDKKPLLPGEKGNICIRYKGKGKEQIAKTVLIYTNVSRKPFEVKIKCTVI